MFKIFDISIIYPTFVPNLYVCVFSCFRDQSYKMFILLLFSDSKLWAF